MPLTVSFDSARRAKPDALALPLFDDQPWPTFSALSAKDRAWLADWRKTKTFRPDRGQALLVHPTPKLPLLLLGLGTPKLLDAQAARLAGANLTRLAQRAGLSRVELVLPPQLNTPTLAHAFGQGAVLARLRFDEFKSPSEPPASSRLRIEVHQSKWLAAAKQGALVSTSANLARRLAATPPNLAHPQAIADACRKMAREVGLRIKVITAPQLRRLGMNGLWSVGRAGSSEPCLIVLEHRGRPSKSQTDPVVLVGKAVTYDTGGYSLKTAEGQRGMKYDKCGGMAVLGALHAAATLKTPTPVVGLIAVAENMVDRRAYRVDDILTLYNGLKVEVTNTDAEGRLILADALTYACRTYKPAALIDLATLTGGVGVALGQACAGLFVTEPRLRQKLLEAGDAAHERLWELPLWPEHRELLRSDHADLVNSGGRLAHPIQGAAFLSHFVGKNGSPEAWQDRSWAHLDIAYVAAVDKPTPLFDVGPTAFGVRLLTHLLEHWRD